MKTSLSILVRYLGRLLAYGIAALLGLGQAIASPIGVYTEVTYQYPGAFNRLVGSSSVNLPPSSFTFPGVGSGGISGSAAASYLSLGTAAFSTATSSNPCCSNGADVRAYAIAQDILTAGALSPTSPGGFISFGFSISGTNLATVSNPGPLTPSARAVVNVASGPDLVNANPVGTTAPGNIYGHVVFGALAYNNSAFTVNIPIFFGTPVVTWIELLSVAEGSVYDGGIYQARSDFASTLTLQSVRILDSLLQPVLNPTLFSQSGTLYPLVGRPGTSIPVPEPSSLALCGLALCAVGILRGRSATHLR